MNRKKSYNSQSNAKPVPGSDLRFEEVFNFPCVADDEAVDYLLHHGRVMFIVRGPPGTGKNTLSSMLVARYPESAKCSANDYFSELFVNGQKNSETLKKSHQYCHQKTLDACKENMHPIIVQNSNIKKWEMQFYIDLAIEWCYTVVMVITVRKLSINAKILEKTNGQGLKKEYFDRRLSQWEEAIPQYTGWVPDPADVACIMAEADVCLELLRDVPDFSATFGNPKNYFRPEYFPFCIASFCGSGTDPLTRHHYLSEEVQNALGKDSVIVIEAFLVTQSFTIAIVHLEEDMKKLILENNGSGLTDEGSLSYAFGALRVDRVIPKQPVTNYVQNSLKTINLTKRMPSERINIKNCSFIVLSTTSSSSPTYPYIKSISEFSNAHFSKVSDPEGNISSSFSTLNDDVKYSKFDDNSWLILPSKMSMKCVFTGLYV